MVCVWAMIFHLSRGARIVLTAKLTSPVVMRAFLKEEE